MDKDRLITLLYNAISFIYDYYTLTDGYSDEDAMQLVMQDIGIDCTEIDEVIEAVGALGVSTYEEDCEVYPKISFWEELTNAETKGVSEIGNTITDIKGRCESNETIIKLALALHHKTSDCKNPKFKEIYSSEFDKIDEHITTNFVGSDLTEYLSKLA